MRKYITILAAICLVQLLLLCGCEQGDMPETPTPVIEEEKPGEDIVASQVWPGEEWQVADSPEGLGWSSDKLDKAKAYSEKIGTAALMIVEDGVVVETWGDITRKYQCHSMRKSMLSALYGIYVAEGKIDLTKTLDELGIDDKKPLTETEKSATVLDLLKARSGVYIRAAGESDSMKAIRPERGSHLPGTFWYYNNWDFNALGTIFDQETGEENIYQAFKSRIAEPIGMQDYVPKRRYTYESYSVHPYYGFRLSTRDLARFGLLFLREGRWGDEQIIPAEWARESTASISERGPESGYGYMWWTGEKNGVFPNVYIDEQVYWAWGYNAHLVIVIPDRNLVIVHREDTDQSNPPVIIEAQLGGLLWLILDAAGEENIGESLSFLDLAEGKHLTAEELREVVPGSTLRQDESIGELAASIMEDGTLSLTLDGQLLENGEWWVEDDMLCAAFSNPNIGGGCVYLVLDGTMMKFYGEDGLLTETYEFSKETQK